MRVGVTIAPHPPPNRIEEPTNKAQWSKMAGRRAPGRAEPKRSPQEEHAHREQVTLTTGRMMEPGSTVSR